MKICTISTWEIRSQLIDSKEIIFYYKGPGRLCAGDLITIVDRQRFAIVLSTVLNDYDYVDQTTINYVVLLAD